MRRVLGLILQCALAIFLLSGLASAESVPSGPGCCTYQGTCTPTAEGCPSGFFFSGVSCSSLPDCRIGCCCDQGIAGKKASCINPTSFVEDSSLSSGQTCSCGSGFSISGFVRQGSYKQGGAVVSAGTITTVSDDVSNLGYYLLNRVPGGPTTVSASYATCTGSVQIPNLDSDRTGVDVLLNCDCTPGCMAASTSYCDNDRIIHKYNISRPEQKQEYCLYCAPDDVNVCGELAECRAGDGACPLGCSATQGDVKYDSDCACLPGVQNGYCPPSCTSDNDGDCGVTTTPGCGDGLVFYPYETCEANPRPGQASFCKPQDCVNCNCVSLSQCGNGKIDAGEQCELGNVCADGSQCLACKCNEKCSTLNLNPTLTSGFDKATKSVSLRWALSDACGSLVNSYVLFSCKKDGSNVCTALDSFVVEGTYPRGTTEASVLVTENSEYSFYVKVFFSDNREGISKVVKVKTGSDFCMNRDDTDPLEFCSDNKRSTCDINNNIKTLEDCNSKSLFCSGPDFSGTTRCEANDACALCNGLYGLFGKYLDLKVLLGQESYFCNAGTGREVVPGCYFDKTQFLFKAFSSCGQVKSCYDFKSQEACTDPADPCGVNKGCEWVPLASNPSLGGVCRPKSPILQDCTLCDDPAYNWVTPACTPETCSLYGTCFYQGVNNTPSCTNRIISNCLKYESEDSCIGFGVAARPVSVDALYGPNNTRLGGTHALTVSNDELGLGKCYWDDVNSKCRRDADGLPVDVDANVGFDCAKGDLMCESDFTNPETVIIASHIGLYPATPKISYSAEDNYPANSIITYFCTARATSSACYPRELGRVSGGNKEYIASGLTESGTYRLYYYSVDPAKNLELVKSVTLQVDADPPFIDLIFPQNESEFAVNTPTLVVQAKTSTDASYVCANNTVLKKTVCVNNCAKGGVSPPCIDSTGLFNIEVPVAASAGSTSSSTPRNVVFVAEDFAGNVYSNTLLGIIYDISPPKAPVITIKSQ